MQQVIKGKNSLMNLPSLLSQTGGETVLFVTGQHLLKESFFQSLLNNLDVPYQLLHPSEGVLQLAAIPAIENINTVIAIGGGKVMDYAKGIIYQYKQPVFFIAAPTTAGSGSEATPIAVFYSGKEKVSLDAPELLPNIALLDPELLSSLPSYQKAVSGADAFAQCVESIWNVHSTDKAEAFSLAGLSLSWNGLSSYVKGDEGLAEEMLWAAHLSGKAITLTRTTGPHAFAYYLTANHDVPHGQAVALTLPLFFLYNSQGNRGEQLTKIFNVLQVQNAEEAFRACRHFFKHLGLATNFKELGQENINLDNWLGSVNQQRFSNNPVPFNEEIFKDLFQRYLC